MIAQTAQRLVQLANQLSEALMTAAICAQEIRSEVQDELDGDDLAAGAGGGGNGSARSVASRPLLDQSTLSVTWHGRSLHLGHTRAFWVLERLSRRPNPQVYPDLYGGLVYTAFQERATKISHANVARLGASRGEANLNRICLKIAGDEGRHEAFYTRMMARVMDEDPEGGIITFRNLMRRIIVMPGKLMFDGKDPDLFDHFATVAQRTGIYSARDYAAITDHLLKTWRVAERRVSGAAARAQDYLCELPRKYASLAERIEGQLKAAPRHPFSWIYGRTA